MRIGLDLDGVVYPWHYSIYKYFTEFKGYEGNIRDFWKHHKQFVTDFHVSIPMLYLDTTPTEDVLTYVPKIAELGEIYYITSRIPDLWHVTEKFFDIYRLPFKENLVFSKNKAQHVRLYRLDVFLDDMDVHVDALQGVTEAYLFHAVHNYDCREKYNCISSMKEFYELLRSKNAKVDSGSN